MAHPRSIALISLLVLLACDAKPATGTLVVLAPGVPTTFTIDGTEAKTVKSVFRLDLAPGPHTIAFTEPTARDVKFEIAANRKLVVPTIEAQCYVAMNLSMSHYAGDDGSRIGGPSFEYLEQQTTPFSPPGDHFFTEAELPEKRSSAKMAGLYVSGTCAELQQVEADQKKAAGK